MGQLRRTSFWLVVGWSILLAIGTVVVWWVGAENRNLINLLFVATLAGGLWLVGLVPLGVLWLIESRQPSAPLVVTFPASREDDSHKA